MKIFLSGLSKRIKTRIRATRLAANFHPRADSTPIEWISKPTLAAGTRVCIFVSYLRSDIIDSHNIYHARAWMKHGFHTILILVMDIPKELSMTEELKDFSGVGVRRNAGLDFAAWSCAIQSIDNLRGADALVLVNDSLYGPLAGFTFMLDRMYQSEADVIGLTQSNHLGLHLQSYIIFFKAKALKSSAFWMFWKNIRIGDRAFVVRNYEVRFAKIMAASGLRVTSLFPLLGKRAENPTLMHWRSLIEAGFPFLKIKVIKENPYSTDISEWREFLLKNGYDIREIERRGSA